MKMRAELGPGRVHAWSSPLAQALGEDGCASDSNVWEVILTGKYCLLFNKCKLFDAINR